MTDLSTEPRDAEAAADPTAELLREVSTALELGQHGRLQILVQDVPAPDLADLIELLGPARRVELIEALGTSFNYDVLSELDETVRDQLSEALPNELLAKAVTELDSDDAAYLLESLEESDKQDVLSQLTLGDRAALQRNLDYPPQTAGRLMQSEFVAVAPFWTVGQVIDFMRVSDDLPDTFQEIFVVDPNFRVLGSVQLSRLLRTKRLVAVEQIMDPGRQTVVATQDQEEVARLFQRYDLVSAPVVDENNRLVGVVTVDDVVEVIQDEAEEDMKQLGGVGGTESLADSVLQTARSRVPWLVVNLGTALLSSTVIQAFGGTIQQMVALAVLMPIVASLGGNAGTQTMTVTVRALATAKLGALNAGRVVTREACVGLINGLLLSAIMATVVFIWFGSQALGAVIGAAIIVNLFAAALAGILIPLALDHWDLDPAPASGVFVTMITDCIGFFAFLGLATMWLV
ncbi:MAG: magnesium transporter [Hyphomicrobium sp.]